MKYVKYRLRRRLTYLHALHYQQPEQRRQRRFLQGMGIIGLLCFVLRRKAHLTTGIGNINFIPLNGANSFLHNSQIPAKLSSWMIRT
jgi:hypothetical protein